MTLVFVLDLSLGYKKSSKHAVRKMTDSQKSSKKI